MQPGLVVFASASKIFIRRKYTRRNGNWNSYTIDGTVIAQREKWRGSLIAMVEKRKRKGWIDVLTQYYQEYILLNENDYFFFLFPSLSFSSCFYSHFADIIDLFPYISRVKECSNRSKGFPFYEIKSYSDKILSETSVSGFFHIFLDFGRSGMGMSRKEEEEEEEKEAVVWY